ncbi:MAG: CheR family methyltransferase [Planctomycetota bacterium]
MAFTYFFRDGQALDLLAEYVIPDLATRRYMDVWDAGCAMGPEPYSIAMTFREHMGPFLFRNLRIWATDIDETKAFGRIIERGVYCEQETKRIRSEIREKYFSRYDEAGNLELSEEIRKAVRFQRHDLLSLEPVREQFGLIVCKNVLLHYSPRQRIEVFKMFHRALSETGYLLTERTQEMPLEVASMFSRVTKTGQLFKKKVPASHAPRPRHDQPHRSPRSLAFELMRREDHGSAYDWMNIDCGATRVGKVRGLLEGRRLTIHSINIFPEFERHGYARETIHMFQDAFDTIVADRVRHTAVGFWKKMGFDPHRDGQYVWRRGER